MTEGISRRNFLAGTGIGAAALASMSIVGCSSSDSTETTEETEATTDWKTAPDAISEDEIVETHDCEILVIGAGAAGSAAIAYATQQGADVCVLQKTEAPTTNGWSFGTWNSQYGEENGITWDIPATLQEFATTYCNGRSNIKLFHRVLEKSADAAEWIVSQTPDMGDVSIMAISDHIVYYWTEGQGTSNRYVGFGDLVTMLVNQSEEAGATVYYETPAVQLLTDDSGAVTGAIGEGADGYVQVNASKGVILATGDVSDDEEMLEAFCPIMVGMPSLHGSPCNTGDGHKMAYWIGADMDRAPFAMMMHYDPSPLYSPAPPFAAVPWLHINENGERFMNENIDYQSSATAVSLQPDHIAFQIFDSNFYDHVYDYTNGGRTFPPTDQEAFDEYVEAGSIFKADSLEELAEAIEVDEDTFLATVERYNELVDSGVDEDFGMASEYFVWNGIKDAPFYAIKREPAILTTCGGVRCNDELQVLDSDHNPISGLYAVGNVQGSFFGYDYPVTGFDGFSIGRSMTGGLLAVQSILGTLGEDF